MENKNQFIELKNINFNTARTGFKYSRKNLKIVVAVSCASLSFILPDFSLGLIIGLCLLSPLSFRNAFKNRVESVKDMITKKYYLMRLKR